MECIFCKNRDMIKEYEPFCSEECRQDDERFFTKRPRTEADVPRFERIESSNPQPTGGKRSADGSPEWWLEYKRRKGK